MLTIFALVMFFIVVTIFVETYNYKLLNPFTQPLSSYLSIYEAPIKFWELQCTGFFALSAVPILLLQEWPFSVFQTLVCIIAFVSLVGVVITKLLQNKYKGKADDEMMGVLHRKIAAVAFMSCAVIILYHTINDRGFAFWITVIGVGLDIMIRKFSAKKEVIAVDEKALLGCLLLATISVTGFIK